jgi:hypothetical protein
MDETRSLYLYYVLCMRRLCGLGALALRALLCLCLTLSGAPNKKASRDATGTKLYMRKSAIQSTQTANTTQQDCKTQKTTRGVIVLFCYAMLVKE